MINKRNADPQVALVSGASSGFGLQISIGLARLHWRVFATVRRAEQIAALEVNAKNAGVSQNLTPILLDVTDATAVSAGVTQVLDSTAGRIDLLVNNAGYTDVAFFEMMSDEQCRSIMETNFFGALALTRAVLPPMREATRGRIAFVSSNGEHPPPHDDVVRGVKMGPRRVR